MNPKAISKLKTLMVKFIIEGSSRLLKRKDI